MAAASVRLVFTRSATLGSAALRAFLWSPWSHVAIVNRDQIIEATVPGGVRTRSLADLLAASSEYAFIDIPCPDPAAVIAAAVSQLGKPYDWRGVIGIGARRRWQDPDAWFCSELIAWAFAQAGHPLVRSTAWRITPRDLHLPIFRAALAI